MKLTKTELARLVEEVMEEAHSKADEEKLKKISKQLKGSAKMHGEQAEDIDDIVDRSDDEELKEGVNCGRGNIPCETYGNVSKDRLSIIIQEELRAVIEEEKSAKDKMKCNSPRRIRKGEPGHGKKKFVVKACQGGKEKIIRFGDANMTIKKNNPKRRKSFRARHKCDTAKDKMTARYWSCKKW